MRKLSGYLIVVVVVFFFFLNSEDGGIPLLNWISDPRGSSERNKELVARDRAFAEGIDPDTLVAGTDRDLPPEELREQALNELLASANTGVRGLVRDLDGEAVPGVIVTIERPPAPPLSVAADPEGKFSFDLADYEGWLAVDSTFYVLLAGEPALSVLGPQPHELVVAPRVDFAGHVVDPEGEPVFGAKVYGYAPLAAAASPDLTVEIPDRFEVTSVSDPEGRYQLNGLPQLAFTRIEVHMDGFEVLRRDAPASSNDDLELRLRHLPEQEGEADAPAESGEDGTEEDPADEGGGRR